MFLSLTLRLAPQARFRNSTHQLERSDPSPSEPQAQCSPSCHNSCSTFHQLTSRTQNQSA